MIAIIEGTDGTGKSTYANHLIGDSGVVLHYGNPGTRNPVDLYITRVLGWLDHTERIVCDRSFIGSRVWSSLGFHAPTLTEDMWRWVCQWYAQHGASVAIVVRPPLHVDDTLVARGESVEQRIASANGQREFIRTVALRDILYMPVAVISSDLIHNHQKEHTTEWN